MRPFYISCIYFSACLKSIILNCYDRLYLLFISSNDLTPPHCHHNHHNHLSFLCFILLFAHAFFFGIFVWMKICFNLFVDPGRAAIMANKQSLRYVLNLTDMTYWFQCVPKIKFTQHSFKISLAFITTQTTSFCSWIYFLITILI